MRVLAHIHTLNEAGIIESAVDALERQTRPPDAIIIVDNGSTDGTLDRVFPEQVTIIRNPTNVGVSGSVRTGMTYALEHGFDWIWILDADSMPEPDALEKLLDLYASWPQNLQDETAFLACLWHNAEDGLPRHGGIFTRHRMHPVRRVPDTRYYPCHVTIWSGCLYRTPAVRQIGLPHADYFIDWDDIQYGYRVMKAGYKGFVDQQAVLRHNVRGTSQTRTDVKFGPVAVKFYELPAHRCYYTCRNMLYFTLHDSAETRVSLLASISTHLSKMVLNFLLRPLNHREQIFACFRGIWHGVTGNMAARY
jgi:rhamnopyranosyl-N-acetylglucosaminyl-diphospho-decaprenol beta-1,3/1,4-galactofuranosyltransferase